MTSQTLKQTALLIFLTPYFEIIIESQKLQKKLQEDPTSYV